MGVNVERFAGFIAGITFAVILSCVLMIIVNKNKRIKTEYDERQELLRGKGYRYGAITAIVYAAILMCCSLNGVSLPVRQEVIYFSIIFVLLLVMTSYCIMTGAYFGLNNDRRRFGIVSFFVVIINLITPVMHIVNGTFIQDGMVSAPCINLLCVILFLAIAIECLIKDIIERKNGEDDEES